MCTRLEGYVCRGAAGARAGRLQGVDLRVRRARLLMPALSDHLALAHEDTAHARIGRRRVKPALRKLERAGHVAMVVSCEHLKHKVTNKGDD